MGQDDYSGSMVDLNIRVTRRTDKIVQARSTFMEGSLMVHGSRLRHLCFLVCTELPYHVPWSSKSGGPRVYTIIDLENEVLGHCKRLCSLEISWMNLQRGEQVDNPIINDNITSLKLNNGWISGAETLQ